MASNNVHKRQSNVDAAHIPETLSIYTKVEKKKQAGTKYREKLSFCNESAQTIIPHVFNNNSSVHTARHSIF